MAYMSRLDAEELSAASALLSRIEAEHKAVTDLMGPNGTWMPQLSGVHGLLSDAMSELRGLIEDGEPVSFRDENREHRLSHVGYGL
ncbi:hypothetical protein ABNQ39_20905 [Azospirillum sp. A26]|uniref:hypothetical protein n=1 Tax=Azospirillum sp. A26 TaxID=3160607 RepID=UPI00366A8609